MNDDFTPTHPDYRPWGDKVPDAIGVKGTATTSLGHPVNVWQANPGVTASHRFWCHGHATGTFHRFGYTPFSGADMATITADEFTLITKKPDVGDVIVFRGTDGDAILHSALVTTATHHFGARTEIRVSSKNGSARLLTNLTLAQVLLVYHDCYWFKTAQTCCGMSETRVSKQYYRRN